MSVVEVEVDSGVMTVTLADEAGRNVLSGELVDGLLAALGEAETRGDVRVVVLTNRGRVFCAGADLAARSAAGGASGSGSETYRRLVGRLLTIPVPVVGRIAGHCVAGGMGLAAATDISVAIDDVRFGFTEVRVGVAPAMISVVCLPKMRPADAREAFLRGNRFSGARAAEMGLINRAVPVERLDAEIAAIVADLLAGGPSALGHAKRLLHEVPAMDLDEAFDLTRRVSEELFAGEEAAEGMAAYLGKRPASWVPSRDEPGS